MKKNTSGDWTKQAKQKQQEVKEQILTAAIQFETDPHALAEYLRFGSRFYKYSPNNTLLLYLQNPFLTYVQSFDQWKKEGYSVKKGEHGLKVWVPIKATFLDIGNGNSIQLSKATKEQKAAYKEGKLPGIQKLVSFRLGNTFDISQTNFPKERYPELFHMGFADADQRMLCNAVASFCETNLGYTVIYDTNLRSISLRGSCNRLTKEITINPLLEDSQRLSTLTHEMGHAILHRTSSEKSTFQKEFEADAISIMFLSDLGIKPNNVRLQHLSQNYKKLREELSQDITDFSEEKLDSSIHEIFSPVFKTYENYVNDFYQEINSSLEKQRLLEMQPLNNDYQNIIDHCTTLLLQENPDLASDSLNKFLEDDLQFNQGKWIKDELNLFNTSEANYISKQLDKISIDSLSAYTKTKTIGISTPDWNIEL